MNEVPLRVLIVEDSEDDALLLVRELGRGGYAPTFARVENAEDMAQALRASAWDLVITDHNMPSFSSLAALDQIRSKAPDTPIIIVSGSIGEEFAVSAMKAGAHDYLMKDNLRRLVPAVERELREAETRRAHRRAQEAIRHMAYHDGLTDLVNRREFERRLGKALESARERDLAHCLLYMDLDQFKLVNDTCGHVAGDELLRQLAMIFQRHVRDNDTLARLGGDEFGVLLESCPSERALSIAEDMRKDVASFRFVWGNRPFAIGISIGVVAIDATTKNNYEALCAADLACYAAKDLGRNRVHLYAEGDVDLARRHSDMQWASRVRMALEEERFLLYRQRILPLNPELQPTESFEFLLRMRERKDRLVAPGAFICAAEHYNLMPELDRWVVQAACTHMAKRLAANSGQPQPGLYFVNLSGMSLNDAAFFSFIRDRLQAHGLPPASICFEITETAAISNLGRTAEFIQDIRRAGCRFALDDFGSGLSSFSYLKSIPVDFIKIDGSFVRNMLNDPMDQAIVESITRIGKVAGIRTIAEFVESHAILSRLRDLGVDYAQGYAIERPRAL